jgi:hypothetical protein
MIWAYSDVTHNIVAFSDLWGRTYLSLQERVQAMLRDPILNETITPAMKQMVGAQPPRILSMTSQEIQSALAKRTLDVGMCGFFVTRYKSAVAQVRSPQHKILYDRERMENFDFTYPSYYSSGLQATVARGIYNRPDVWVVIAALLGTIDAKAQLIGILLVLFVMIFGHFIALAENVFARLNDDEIDIRDNYFEGTQDGMWFSLVVMSTVRLERSDRRVQIRASKPENFK